jgi:hypothetical protein
MRITKKKNRDEPEEEIFQCSRSETGSPRRIGEAINPCAYLSFVDRRLNVCGYSHVKDNYMLTIDTLRIDSFQRVEESAKESARDMRRGARPSQPSRQQ